MAPRYIVFSLLSIWAVFSQSVCASNATWNLNDVSYLFMLPAGNEHASIELLGPDDHSLSGSLLPQEIYTRLPTLLIGGNGNKTLYENSLRVVAARIDPCPTLKPGACFPEIRLVWQPVEFDDDKNKWLARDAAVHCFYRLSAQDFELLKKDLQNIKHKLSRQGVNTNLQPLNVHPALQQETTAAMFNQDIQQTLLKYTGKSNLEKITFIALMTPKRWWRFGAFEKTPNNQWTSNNIPRLDLPTVDIFNVATNDGVGLGLKEGVDSIFNILPEDYPDTDNLFNVINKSYRFNDERDQGVFKDKLDVVARFQNPHSTNTDNLDCASCHFADATKHYMGLRFPGMNRINSKNDFVNPEPLSFNLQNTTPTSRSARNVRAFGYFGDEPVVSQRTINESAVSANWLNTYH